MDHAPEFDGPRLLDLRGAIRGPDHRPEERFPTGPLAKFGDIQQTRRALAHYLLDPEGIIRFRVTENTPFTFVSLPWENMHAKSHASVQVHATHYTFRVHNFAALCTVPHVTAEDVLVGNPESFVENQLFLALCPITDPENPQEKSLGVVTEAGDLELHVPLHHDPHFLSFACKSVTALGTCEGEQPPRKRARPDAGDGGPGMA